MALLGKISAVITANATDFTRTIGNVKSELNSLQKKVQGYRLNLETAALDKTLTKVQLFRRTLQEALGKKIDVGALQDLYKVFEDVGKPLTKVKNQIESLSNSTQAYLYPALERAQKGFQNLFNEIKAGTTTFDAAQGRINSLTRQIERLKASTAVVADFAKLTGSLSTDSVGAKFVQPRALEELQKFIALRDKAAQLPADQRENPFFQGIIRDASAAGERIEALVSKIEKAKLKAALAESVLSRNPTSPIALRNAATATEEQRRAQTQLDRETDAQRLRNQRLANATTLSAVAGLRAPAAATETERTAEKAAQAIQALRSAGLDSYAEQIRTTAEAASTLAQGSDAAAAALAKLNSQAAAGIRLAGATDSIRSLDQDSRKRADALTSRRVRVKETLDEATAAGVPPEGVTAARRRDFLSNEIGGRIQNLQGKVSGIEGEAGKKLQAQLDAATKSLQKLVSTDATPAISQIVALRNQISGLEKDINAANKQQQLLNEFDSSTAINLQPRAVKDYINDFQLLLNLGGNLNEELGTKFGASLEASRAKVKSLYQQIAAQPRTPEGNANAERLLAQIRAESKALATELAGLDPTRFTEKQLNRLLSANRRLRGDISGLRGSAQAGQLALQQLTFAVDDFFSSTGGFEYKLRAISNNISQFGFVLGGTKGLMAAVAATSAVQLLIQFGGIGKASKEAEGALKFMNDELEKSRNLAEQTTKAFEDLAKALRTSTSSGPRGDIEQRVRDLREEQKKSREAQVRSASPEVSSAAGARAAAEERLSQATGSDRVRIARELEQLRKRERDAIARSTTPLDGRTPRGPLTGVRDLLEKARQAEILTLNRRETAAIVPFGEQRRSERLAGLRAERISAPTTQQEAVKAIESRLDELIKTQQTADPIDKLSAQLTDALGGFRVAMPGRFDAVNAFQQNEKTIADLNAELERLKEVIKSGADDIAAGFAEQALIAQEEIKGVFKDLAALRLDGDVQGRFEEQFKAPAAGLADAVKKIEEALRLDPNADISALKAEAGAAGKSLEALYQQADKIARDAALGKLIPTADKLSSAAQLAGGQTIAGSNAARFEADRQELGNRRRRAELRGPAGAADVAAIDKELEKIRLLADEVGKAAIAVAAFQRAAEEAALNLSRTLVNEAQSDVERARRRANRVAGDAELGPGARRDAAEAERRRREQEDSDRQLQRELENERLKFEREKSGDGRVGDLARAVQEGRRAQEDKTLGVGEQLAGKQRADEAEAQLQRLLRDRLKPFEEAANARDRTRQAEIEESRRRNERTVAGVGVASGIQGGNKQMAAALGGDAIKAAAELSLAMEEAKRKVDDAAQAGADIPDELRDRIKELAKEIEAQRQDFVKQTTDRAQNRAGGFDAQSKRARDEVQGFASNIEGELTALEVQRQSLEKKRDEALQQNFGELAATIQNDINAMDAHAEQLNAAAIAVGAFQAAANKAALDLQNKVASESQGAAEAARRRANEAEAIFGEKSPQAREARAEQKRREDAARAADDEAARARKRIAEERVKFENEIANGANPAAAARAEKIRQLEADAADERKTAADREAARAEADRLRREQEREFENRPEVQAERRRADEADRERARKDSAARGRELMKTERQRAEEAVKASAGDIANAVKDMRDEGAGRQQIQDATQTAANNLGRQAAPMLAGFADEVMNARLAGPSRAALNAQDVQTTEGARELNRLLRGDDASKDVNILELRKQSELLQAIENAIKAQTGVVVDL
jgi:hypothetical protein